MSIVYHNLHKPNRLIDLLLAYPGAVVIVGAVLFWTAVGVTLALIL